MKGGAREWSFKERQGSDSGGGDMERINGCRTKSVRRGAHQGVVKPERGPRGWHKPDGKQSERSVQGVLLAPIGTTLKMATPWTTLRVAATWVSLKIAAPWVTLRVAARVAVLVLTVIWVAVSAEAQTSPGGGAVGGASGTGRRSSSPSATELLARVDANEVYDSITYEGEMVIEYQGKRFVKVFKAAGRGNSDSFVEFLNPEDRGTKYLKKDGRLYVYSPDTESVMLISGHLLKESMMGSDLSYEDTIDNETLSARYTPTLAGTDEVRGRKSWVLELVARKRTESYPKRKLWVDVDTQEVLRMEMFALSGAKLKEYELIRSERIGSRYFPVEFQMRDLLRRDSRTVFRMRNVVLDAKIPDSVFSLRNLRR